MKLSAPLRLVWHWRWPPVVRRDDTPADPPPEALVRNVAAAVSRAQILMLEIGYPGAEACRGGLLASAIETAAAQTTLVLTPATIAALGEEGTAGLAGAAEVWADVTPEPDATGTEALPLTAAGAPWPSLRIFLTRANRQAAAALIERAAAAGTGSFSLPNLPVFGRFLSSSRELIPGWRDLVSFADRVAPVLRRLPRQDLRVHDQALWMLLRERGLAAGEGDRGHTGCQAGAALGYVDPQGVLYPCASLPVPLGSLAGDGEIGGFWSSAGLTGLRARIEALPSACAACELLEACQGGCRGWAEYLTGSWEETGPDCARSPADAAGETP